MPARRHRPASRSARRFAALVARTTPARSRVFLRQVRQALREAGWRDHRRGLLRQLYAMEERWSGDCAQIESALRIRRAQLALLAEVRACLTDPGAVKREGRRHRRNATPERMTGNAGRVLETMRAMGGEGRAGEIVEAVRRRHPGFGGASYRTQIYQILRSDPRIERLARGRYRVRRV